MTRLRSTRPATLLFLLTAWLAAGCATTGPAPRPAAPAAAPAATAAAPGAATPAAPTADSRVRFTLLQLNDVYEITPVEGGKRGGLARVATVRKELLAANPNTFTVLAGDLISPSALGTAKVDGERLSGKQMIAVLNALGLDYATFGNHEFDFTAKELLARLAESRFRWISANVFDAEGRPFPGVATDAVFTVADPPGADTSRVRVALIGVTLTKNAAPWVRYTEPMAAMRERLAALGDSVDVRIGLTHLSLDEDVALAEQVPELDFILGGHEHENVEVRRGGDFTPIAKADANARSVWIHDFAWDPATKKLDVASRFLPISDAIADDPEVAKVVDDWVERGYAGFRSDGFEPEAVVTTVPVALDGRESSVRNGPTGLTDLIAEGFLAAAPGTELAVYNSGSIRIDDQIPPGEVTQYDVIRVLPFGGIVQTAELRGRLLAQTLDQGAKSAGTGAYLQTARVTGGPGAWQVAGQPIADDTIYRVAISDFLASGREQGLEFLNPQNPDFLSLANHDDIRKALIAELERRYPPPAAAN
jgi:5'-nucleotidase / UDP-sugar diphosphatase